MQIVRKIWAEKLEDIDFKNLGCHWTTDETVLAKYSSIQLNGNDNEGNSFYLYADSVEESIINIEATEISNTDHPSEKEVVLIENSKIIISEIIDLDGNSVAFDLEANTGIRVDEWVKNLK
jgi:hypothetical protein